MFDQEELADFKIYFETNSDEFADLMKKKPPRIEVNKIRSVCLQSKALLQKQESLVDLKSPQIVIGDIHGNFVDMMRIFRSIDDFSSRRFVFLGDYVDRGDHSVEVIYFLLALFCKMPDSVCLIRGNHEFADVNRTYGFYEEIMAKYNDESVWMAFNDCFNYLPLAARIDKRIICIHGGISPLLESVDQIRQITRPLMSANENPLVLDIVWSDPSNEMDGYKRNNRGSGKLFGNEPLRTFLKNSKAQLLIRGHQCVVDGCITFAVSLGITVFSSSNYISASPNRCGFLIIQPDHKFLLNSFPRGQDVPTIETKEMNLVKNLLGLRRAPKPVAPRKLFNSIQKT